MKGIKFSALLGATLLTMSTAATAQTTNADDDYLSDLHSFLEGQDTVTYTMATSVISPEQNVWAAQMFCQSFSSGVSPADAFGIYTSAALGEANAQNAVVTEEMAYAVGLYGGAVMNLGAAHYCPQYQSQVQQALQTLSN
ncbi:MAG: DUF732 domain-containing protein [Phormidesmis sp.]